MLGRSSRARVQPLPHWFKPLLHGRRRHHLGGFHETFDKVGLRSISILSCLTIRFISLFWSIIVVWRSLQAGYVNVLDERTPTCDLGAGDQGAEPQ